MKSFEDIKKKRRKNKFKSFQDVKVDRGYKLTPSEIRDNQPGLEHMKSFEDIKKKRRKNKFKSFQDVKVDRGYKLTPSEIRDNQPGLEQMDQARIDSAKKVKKAKIQNEISKKIKDPAIQDFAKNNPDFNLSDDLPGYEKGSTYRSFQQIKDEYDYQKQQSQQEDTDLADYYDDIGANAKIEPYDPSAIDTIKNFNRKITGNNGIPKHREEQIKKQELLNIPQDYDTSGNLDFIRAKWRLGQLQDLSSKEWTKKAKGVENIADDVDRAIMEMVQKYPELQDPDKGWLVEGAGGTAEMLPTQINAQIEGAKKGLPAGLTSAGAAIAAGQAGPQVAIPEEVITGPAAGIAGYKAGATIGTAEYMAQIEKGSAYKEMIQKGVDEEKANKYSTLVGMANAGVELAQIGTFLKSFKNAGKALSNPVLKGQLTKKGAKVLGEYVKNVLSETGQEVVQEGITMTGVAAASGEKPGKEETLDRLLETAVQSAKAFSVMMGLTSGASAAMNMDYSQFKNRSKDFETKIDKVIDEIENEEIDPMKLGELENTLNEIRTNTENDRIEKWASDTYDRLQTMKEEKDISYLEKKEEKTESKKPTMPEEPTSEEMDAYFFEDDKSAADKIDNWEDYLEDFKNYVSEETPDTIKIENSKNDQYAILHPSTREDFNYQVSIFDDKGPTMHYDFNTKKEAAEKLTDLNYNDINKLESPNDNLVNQAVKDRQKEQKSKQTTKPDTYRTIARSRSKDKIAVDKLAESYIEQEDKAIPRIVEKFKNNNYTPEEKSQFIQKLEQEYGPAVEGVIDNFYYEHGYDLTAADGKSTDLIENTLADTSYYETDYTTQEYKQKTIDEFKEKEAKEDTTYLGTATAGFKEDIEIDPKYILENTEGGLTGEDKRANDPTDKYGLAAESLTEKIAEEGFDKDNPIFINVDGNGNAWINEGNKRVRAAIRLGIDKIPAEIKYYDFGEEVQGKAFEPMKISEHKDKQRILQGPSSMDMERQYSFDEKRYNEMLEKRKQKDEETFRYYTTQRPPGPGAVPPGAKNAEMFDDKTDGSWGYVEYDKPLTQKQIDEYELSEEKPKSSTDEAIESVLNEEETEITYKKQKDFFKRVLDNKDNVIKDVYKNDDDTMLMVVNRGISGERRDYITMVSTTGKGKMRRLKTNRSMLKNATKVEEIDGVKIQELRDNADEKIQELMPKEASLAMDKFYKRNLEDEIAEESAEIMDRQTLDNGNEAISYKKGLLTTKDESKYTNWRVEYDNNGKRVAFEQLPRGNDEYDALGNLEGEEQSSNDLLPPNVEITKNGKILVRYRLDESVNPETSFNEFLEEKGLDPNEIIPTGRDYANLIGGAVSERTKSGKGKVKSVAQKIGKYQDLQNEYSKAIANGSIKTNKSIKEIQLDKNSKADQAYIRVMKKRAKKKLESEGIDLKEINNETDTKETVDEDLKYRGQYVDYENAYEAHRNMSMSPDKRAKAEQRDFVTSMEQIEEEVMKVAETPEMEVKANELLDELAEKAIKKKESLLASKTRVASTMVTGPANFDSRKNNKRATAYENKSRDYIDFLDKQQENIIKKVKDATPADLKLQKQIDKYIKEADRALAVMKAHANGEKGFSKSAVRNSLKGKLKTLAKNGEVEVVEAVLDYVDKNQSKPVVFSSRNSVWDLVDKAEKNVEKMSEMQNKDPEVIQEYQDGTIIENDFADERVKIYFPEKPDALIRQEMKSHAWRWSPRNEAWQRKNTGAAVESAKRIVDSFKEKVDEKVETTETETYELNSDIRKSYNSQIVTEADPALDESEVRARSMLIEAKSEDDLYTIQDYFLSKGFRSTIMGEKDGDYVGYVDVPLQGNMRVSEFKKEINQLYNNLKNGNIEKESQNVKEVDKTAEQIKKEKQEFYKKSKIKAAENNDLDGFLNNLNSINRKSAKEQLNSYTDYYKQKRMKIKYAVRDIIKNGGHLEREDSEFRLYYNDDLPKFYTTDILGMYGIQYAKHLIKLRNKVEAAEGKNFITKDNYKYEKGTPAKIAPLNKSKKTPDVMHGEYKGEKYSGTAAWALKEELIPIRIKRRLKKFDKKWSEQVVEDVDINALLGQDKIADLIEVGLFAAKDNEVFLERTNQSISKLSTLNKAIYDFFTDEIGADLYVNVDEVTKHTAKVLAVKDNEIVGLIMPKRKNLSKNYIQFKPTDKDLANDPSTKYSKSDSKAAEKLDAKIPGATLDKMDYNANEILTKNEYKAGPLKNKNLKPVKSILKDLSNYFKVGITSSRYRSKAYAHYKPFPKVIETSVENTLGPILHELGHFIDDKYNFSQDPNIQDQISNMIQNMPDEFKKQYNSQDQKFEAVAEFLRLYMTSPTDVIQYSGDFLQTFVNTLDKKDLQQINERRNEVLDWLNASMREQIGSKIVSRMDNSMMDKIKKHFENGLSELKLRSYMFFQDDLASLNELRDLFSKVLDRPLKGEDNFYKLALHSRHSSMISKAITTDKMLDPDGNIIGPGFKEIVGRIDESEYHDFSNYVVLKRAIDYMARGKRVFSDDVSSESIKQAIASYEREKPHFVSTADDLYKWWNSFTESWLVDTGLMQEDLFKKLKEIEPHYVPFFREIDNQAVVNGQVVELARGGFTDQRNPIRRSSTKGSAKPILDPIESMIIEIERYVGTVNKRKVMLKIHDLYQEASSIETDTGIGYIINKVNPAMEASQVDVQQEKSETVVRLLENFAQEQNDQELNEYISENDYTEALSRADELGFEAHKIVDETIEDVITKFKPMEFDKEQNIVSVKDREGKTHHYEIQDPYVLQALLNMNTKSVDGVARAIGSMRRVMQGLITTFDPMFIIRNLSRDVLQGAVASNAKLSQYPKALARSIKSELTGGEWAKAYKRAGGGFASPTGADRNALAEAKGEIIPGWKKEHKLQSVLQKVENFSDAVEQAPRIAEFNKFLEENGDTPGNRIEAMFEAQDVTVNFKRRGSIMNHWYGQFVPFFNAALQGLDKFRRLNPGLKALKGDKQAQKRLAKTAIRATSTITLLQITQMALFRDDEEYDKVSNYIKDNYWLLPTDTKGKYIRIPKPRELAVAYGSVFERAFNQVMGNDKAWKDFSDTLVQNFAPQVRTLAAPYFDIKANETWYGGDIIPYAYQSLQKDEQYDRNTSKIARNLAKIIPDSSDLSSPMNIDYLLKQWTGVVGKMLIPMTDKIKGNALETPKRAFTTDTAYSNNSVSSFYEKLRKLDAAYNTVKRRGRYKGFYDPTVHEFYKAAADGMRTLYDVQDQLNEIKTLPVEKQQEKFKELIDNKSIKGIKNIDELQRTIQYKIREIAEKANETYEKAKQGK